MSSARGGRQALIDAIGMALRESSALSVLHSHALAAKLGINSTDLECLDLVTFGRNVTAGSLAEATGLTTGAITGVIDRLERAGFVRRERDKADRRKVMVVATTRVQQDAEPMGAPMREAVSQALGRYDEDQLELLRQVLDDLSAAAKAAIGALKAGEPAGQKRPSSRAR